MIDPYAVIPSAATELVADMESNDSVKGFSGRLDNFPLLDVIQMACVAQRDGRLSIRHEGEGGEVLVRRGQIVHVQTMQAAGEEALLEILCWQTGRFVFSPMENSRSVERSIYGGWEHVLMEAVRKRDERLHREGFEREKPLQRLRPELASHILREIDKQRRRATALRQLEWAVALLLGCGGLVAVILLGTRFGGQVRSRLSALYQQLNKELVDRSTWEKKVLRQVSIPSGEFVYQDGQNVKTAAFSIDATEVTVWQYAEFLQALGNRTDFDHEAQPKNKGHTNRDWEEYAGAAFAFGEFRGMRVTPNCPAAFVDWFDAYAYAKWKGHRLPTEQEWEKAARGVTAFRYPWGDRFEPGAANLSSSKSHLSGWSEVASWLLDRSSYGVFDMAGNVSEWTGSWNRNGNPVVRGGNFMNEEGETTRRIVNLPPLTIDERVGFRTVANPANEK